MLAREVYSAITGDYGGLQKKWKNYPHSWKQGCGFVVVLLQKIHRHQADGDIFGTWK